MDLYAMALLSSEELQERLSTEDVAEPERLFIERRLTYLQTQPWAEKSRLSIRTELEKR